MRRREFVTFIGGAAVGWPLGAQAQQPTGARRIGFLIGDEASLIAAFKDELGQARLY